jgi:hypothetical protein
MIFHCRNRSAPEDSLEALQGWTDARVEEW